MYIISSIDANMKLRGLSLEKFSSRDLPAQKDIKMQAPWVKLPQVIAIIRQLRRLRSKSKNIAPEEHIYYIDTPFIDCSHQVLKTYRSKRKSVLIL